MKTSIIILVLILALISLVNATTTWYSDVYWHPSGSNSWYNFAEDQTDLDHIYMNPTSFAIPSEVSGESDLNFTIWSDTNATLNSWNVSFTNITVTGDLNLTYCGLNVSALYYVVKDASNIVSALSPDVATCINFNVSDSGTYTIQDYSAIFGVSYSAFNGSTYVYAFNQSIDFYCFPRHTNCVPRYQNGTQWLFNYTNTESSTKEVFLTLNESVQGYTLKASPNNLSSSAVNLSTTRIGIDNVTSGSEVKIWFWVDTLYPFTSWYSTIDMEVA